MMSNGYYGYLVRVVRLWFVCDVSRDKLLFFSDHGANESTCKHSNNLHFDYFFVSLHSNYTLLLFPRESKIHATFRRTSNYTHMTKV